MAGDRLIKALEKCRKEYKAAPTRQEKSMLLDEFCRISGYHRKYANKLLSQPCCGGKAAVARPKRSTSYSTKSLEVIAYIWEKAGHPCSQRLKPMLPQWLSKAQKHIPGLTEEVKAEVLSISARQIDRRLQKKKQALKHAFYGRTKPGTLLKHHIPVKTDCWDVTEPGFTEVDLVSHSGPCAAGEFLHSLNITDIQTAWVETRAIMGKGQTGVTDALDDIRSQLPFALKGLDSDNGSEFINHHLVRYCEQGDIQFTRGRPYMKNDNAHVEQKNWTHVRKVFGWDRYDTVALQKTMNDLYKNELSLMMNLFQASVKLVEKVRVGSKVTRRYDTAQTPLDRLVAYHKDKPLPLAVQKLLALRDNLDPFELSEHIEQKLAHIERLRRGESEKKSSVL